MNKLAIINNNTIDSREIADMMGINHWEVLRKLEGTEDGKIIGIIPVLNDNKIVVVDYFIEDEYKDAKGEKRKCYQCTKMGCEFLANKFTGEKGILFTAKYVKKFNQMEQGGFKLPTNYKEALLQLVQAEEEKEKLQGAIGVLETETRLLTKQTLEWADRKVIEAIVKKYGGKVGYQDAWRDFKKELLYAHGINLNSRITNYLNETGKKTKPKTLDMIHDEEIPNCVSTAVALCKNNGVSIEDILEKYKVA